MIKVDWLAAGVLQFYKENLALALVLIYAQFANPSSQ
jgi:hypothetical protein